MEEILKNMDEAKRDRIINAALEEFADHGFKKASTNNIVKNAGISKGLLFHYFENKESLYEYLEKYVVNTVIETLENEIDWEETDFFNRLMQVAMIKGRLTYRFPKMFEFFTTILSDKSLDEIYAYREDFAPGLLEKVYVHNIDYSRFKPDIDMERTMKIINWVIEKYSMELLDKLLQKKTYDYDAITADFEEYMKILKKAFYK
ncbi:MAG TPA: TetR/AcrR family transcriptional regulator [Clostridia bacterium]|nr:TetR/AcrR family transcriptional regulator [Clostridia bacterium]HRX41448.1 TetR/AcrR family transcriptional regulator [Clostridia bacterium]